MQLAGLRQEFGRRCVSLLPLADNLPEATESLHSRPHRESRTSRCKRSDSVAFDAATFVPYQVQEASALNLPNPQHTMLAIKNGMMQPEEGSDKLTELARDFMMKHQAAYGKVLLKPKHHWLVDVAHQVLRDHMALYAFVIEPFMTLIRR